MVCLYIVPESIFRVFASKQSFCSRRVFISLPLGARCRISRGLGLDDARELAARSATGRKPWWRCGVSLRGEWRLVRMTEDRNCL